MAEDANLQADFAACTSLHDRTARPSVVFQDNTSLQCPTYRTPVSMLQCAEVDRQSERNMNAPHTVSGILTA